MFHKFGTIGQKKTGFVILTYYFIHNVLNVFTIKVDTHTQMKCPVSNHSDSSVVMVPHMEHHVFCMHLNFHIKIYLNSAVY